MIQAGQYIDSTLGVKFGLATMTAAAAGQVVSDVSGVLFGGTLESLINRFSPNPVAASLSMAQRQSAWGRYASLAGAVLGVTVGCALGALTLFFVDLEARDRIQRAQQFKEVLGDMTRSQSSFPCRQVVVHLAVQAHQRYDWKSLNNDNEDDDDDDQEGSGAVVEHDENVTTAAPCVGPRVRVKSLDLEQGEDGAATAKNDNDDESSWVVKAAHQQNVLVHGQCLYAPIKKQWDDSKSDEIWAVVEFEKDGEEASETDIQKVELMASHLAIFMHRMSSD